MRILILEDRELGMWMADVLTSDGHRVYCARNPSEADAILANNRIACLIIDLNLPTIGLSKEESAASAGAALTGWVWLTRALKTYPALRERTIIYSEYLAELRRAVPDLPREITLLPKRGTVDSAETVREQVRVISQLEGEERQ
jgi:hypothetical protein